MTILSNLVFNIFIFVINKKFDGNYCEKTNFEQWVRDDCLKVEKVASNGDHNNV